MKQSSILGICLAVVIGISTVGCGERNPLPGMDVVNDTNIKRLFAFYDIYKNAHNNEGPESKEELTSFLTSDNTAKILVERMKVSNIDDVFVSERDNKPFKVKWGATGIEDHAVIFEEEGVEGKRFVAFATPRELSDSDYDRYWKMDVTKKGKKKKNQEGSLDDFMQNFDPSSGR